MTIPNWSMLSGLINIIASVQNIMPRRFLRYGVNPDERSEIGSSHT